MTEITDLVSDYQTALLEEHALTVELVDARAALEAEKARILAEAYATEMINGSNAEKRKQQEAALLDNSNSVYWLEVYARKAALAADLAEIDRKAIEAEISLTKAWWYSMAKVGQ